MFGEKVVTIHIPSIMLSLSLVCFAAGGLWLCCWGDVWIAGSVSSPGSLSPLVLLPSHHRGEKRITPNFRGTTFS